MGHVEKVHFWFLESRLTRNISKMKFFKCFTLRTRTLRPFFHGLRDRRMRRAHAILCMHSHWMLVVQLCNFAAQLSYSTLTEGRKLSNYYKAFVPLGWTTEDRRSTSLCLLYGQLTQGRMANFPAFIASKSFGLWNHHIAQMKWHNLRHIWMH